MERIADNFAAIRAKLEEIEAAKVKARGGETGGITSHIVVENAEQFAREQSQSWATINSIYGTPVVNGGCYQAPDDFMG